MKPSLKFPRGENAARHEKGHNHAVLFIRVADPGQGFEMRSDPVFKMWSDPDPIFKICADPDPV